MTSIAECPLTARAESALGAAAWCSTLTQASMVFRSTVADSAVVIVVVDCRRLFSCVAFQLDGGAGLSHRGRKASSYFTSVFCENVVHIPQVESANSRPTAKLATAWLYHEICGWSRDKRACGPPESDHRRPSTLTTPEKSLERDWDRNRISDRVECCDRRECGDGRESEAMEEKWDYEGGVGHRNSHSLDQMQQRKLLLDVCILRECGISQAETGHSRVECQVNHSTAQSHQPVAVRVDSGAVSADGLKRFAMKIINFNRVKFWMIAVLMVHSVKGDLRFSRFRVQRTDGQRREHFQNRGGSDFKSTTLNQIFLYQDRIDLWRSALAHGTPNDRFPLCGVKSHVKGDYVGRPRENCTRSHDKTLNRLPLTQEFTISSQFEMKSYFTNSANRDLSCFARDILDISVITMLVFIFIVGVYLFVAKIY
ncbi:hypothetical protein EVAR_56214_1 [Eumeta japonica]|uniref:Uncharacterized protein n=1 Tax=Eumeta variegata TaxID=151549 RepID=A0A4C1YWT0_EUMVA|nr:hypothetical protein EVAR_56214_1 [Eumeta japonica]